MTGLIRDGDVNSGKRERNIKKEKKHSSENIRYWCGNMIEIFYQVDYIVGTQSKLI